MDRDTLYLSLTEAAQQHHVRPEAVTDFVQRGLTRFPGDASLAEVLDWATTLPSSAPHLFSTPQQERQEPKPGVGVRPEHQGLSVVERNTRYRPPAEKRKHLEPVILGGEELARVKKLSLTEQLAESHKLAKQRRG